MVEHADDASKFGSSSMSSSLPLLVFHHHGQHEDNQANDEDEMLMFSISKQSLHTNIKRGLLLAAAGTSNSSSMCWATPQGWMLLVTQGSACLWNPLTGDKLPLPDITEEEHRFPQTCTCQLTYKDPRRPGCVVVLLHPSTPDLWYCQVINGDDTRWRWRHYSYDIGNYNLPEAYCPPTKMVISKPAAFQGRLYFIKSVTHMCAIDFTSSSSSNNDDDHPAFHYFAARKVDPKAKGACSIGDAWLLDLDDQLFLVDVTYVSGVDPHDIGNIGPHNIGGATRVYKMDLSKKTPRWRRVRDIGDTVFLLDNRGTTSCLQASLHGLKGNQVYFMKNFIQNDADLCVFDLESECQEITRVHNHDGLLLLRKPFWIVPPNC